MAQSKDLSLVPIEPYDKWLSKLLVRLGLLDASELVSELDQKDAKDESDTDNDDDNDEYLLSLDPKNWKQQDHYAILRLKTKRIKAPEEQIKKNYRKIVLKHHPDKRGNQGETNIDLDHDYYSCITRAYEILSDPVKKRSYDSIDPTLDDNIPPANANSKANFYDTFADVFKRNARWSNITPVPDIGNDNSSYDDVTNFYNFWYNFDSWREYSYLDEEDKEKGENREERRWLDKQNKAQREKRKKEEMQRIRRLVDNAYNCDPRVQRFKEEEKRQKEELKKAKQYARKQRKEEELRRQKEVEEQERKQREDREREEKAKREEERKQKEALKKKIQKERKQLDQLFKSFGYFAENETEKIELITQLDRIRQIFNLEEIIRFRESISEVEERREKRKLFLKTIQDLNKRLEKERQELAQSNTNLENGTEKVNSKKVWSHEDRQLLIKAVQLFPQGTKDRWQVIATFINNKSKCGIERTFRDCIDKIEEIKNSAETVKEEVKKHAVETLVATKSPPVNESAPSQRFDVPATIHNLNNAPWTNEEQQLLEQALKTYPANVEERWDKIAECIPNRSRLDVIKRVKEVAEMIRAKKEAQATARKGKKS